MTKETCPFKDALYPVSQLQADLIKAGFVTRVGEFDKERHQFLPGSKTLRYLNQYLDERGTSGTQLSALAEFKKLEHEARIRSLEEDVKNHSKQLSEIHEAIKEIHEFSPPVTPEKIANHLRLAK